jgi:hypothetical protein
MRRAEHNWLDLVGRLEPGVTMEAAKTEMDVLWRQLAATDPKLYRDRRPILSFTRVTAPVDRPGVTTYTGLLLGIAA